MAIIKGASGEVKFPADWITNSGCMISLREPRKFYNNKSRGWQDAFAEVMFRNIQQNKHKWEDAEEYVVLYMDLEKHLTGVKGPGWADRAIRVILDEDLDSFKDRVFDWLDRNKKEQE